MHLAMDPVKIIGVGMSPQDLTDRHLKLIEQADILVGGKRLLDFFKDSIAQKKSIGKNIDDVSNFVKKKMKGHNIVVLASGDPLFFGIGARLLRVLGPENVVIYPNISTVAAAFARIKEPWNDAQIISLHGKKNERQLLEALEKEDKLAVFTDPKKNPAWLASRLIENDKVDFQMCVLEELGSSSERFGWYSLSQAVTMEFSTPNLVVLKRDAKHSDTKAHLFLGMPDSWFAHQEGLITKSEVRAVTLSKLRLSTNHILWDLGAGSGSISIEASSFVKKGQIFAVEKSPQRIEQIRRNKKRFNVKNLEVIQSVLPEGLAGLPAPDRIFIGGGGKDLTKIIKTAAAHLKPNGIMVINTVLIPNLQVTNETLHRLDFQTDIVQVQISRSTDMPWGERLEAQNPVWIISGIRKAENK
jgi:precorrin-6Y C5,15-methyltransferase (decarboxylating)